MSAYEENLPVDKHAEHRSRSLLNDYKQKLIVNGKPVPDPFSLEDDWLDEANDGGLTKWPSLYYMDIERFLYRLNAADDLLRRLECDYKEGKVYCYFKCEFVKEIFYHAISPTSAQCILKCRVTPSMNLSNQPYHVWAILEKDSEKPGGHIHPAYCTCTAGLLGCCNHVIAMLFRVEAAVITGATKPSSTSLLAKWNVPTGTKIALVHKPISDMVFLRHEYRKTDDKTGEKIAESNKKFQKLSAYTPKQATFLKDKAVVRTWLYETLKDSLPNSSFVEMMEGKRKSVTDQQSNQPLPLGVKDMADIFQVNANLSTEDNIKLFTEKIKLSPDQITNIEKLTKQQSNCSEWYKQRNGRVTASKLSKIYTRMETLKSNPTENADNLVRNVLYAKPFDRYATRHGIALEPHAKKVVIRLLKIEMRHKNLISEDVGTTVCAEMPYFSASPDLKISCSCCGNCLVEIKCPYTLRDQSPVPELLPQLTKNPSGTWYLHKKSSHYYQIQGQLGVTGLKFCWYFVYTTHGHYLEQITFDETFYKAMLENVNIFWYNHLAPELLYPKLKNELNAAPNENIDRYNELKESATAVVDFKKTASKKRKQRKQKSMPKPVFICGECTRDIPTNADNFEENSIGCDICKRWFHFGCVTIKSDKDIPDESRDWICKDCSSFGV